jgi:hypothetical protein
MLRQVAYHMQATEKGLAGNLIRGEDLENILTSYLKSIEVSQARTVARLLIEQLRSRNFILCFVGADSYAFVHRTFLEYFCAYEFVERFGKRGLEGALTLEELKTEVFGKHWQDESWHEVLRLVVGMIDTSFAGQIIDYLMVLDGEAQKFINLFLAAECLIEVRNRNLIAATADRLLESLKKLTEYYKPYEREEYDYDEGITRSIPVDIGVVCERAVVAVATTWQDTPDTSIWLKNVIQSDNWVVKSDAVKALAKNCKNDPQTLLWLKHFAQSSNSVRLRVIALQELAQGWSKEPDMLEFLCNCAVDGFFEPEEDWQLEDEPPPRQVIIETLVEQYPNHYQTFVLLRDRAENDLDYEVRAFALQELTQGWNTQPDTLPILKSHAQSDEHSYVRKVALEIIIKQYRDQPQTLSLLQDRAENDPDDKVREFAREKLEQLERQN